MAFNNVISRTDIQALIPEDVQREIVQAIPEQSAIMSLGRRLPDMSRDQRRIPVLSSLITASFLTAETGTGSFKATGEQAWNNKYINAEELAVLVPIPENVLADTSYDVWSEIRPRIVEAFGKAIDLAILFGTSAPVDWPDDLLSGATSAGNSVSLAASTDIFDAVLGESGTCSAVEQDGFEVMGHVGALSTKGKLRGLRDANGQPIFMTGLNPGGGGGAIQTATRYELDGSPIYFPRNGGFDSSQALLFSGDWSQLVWAMRQDITFKLLTEAVITDSSGVIQFNLAQQDMVCLRAVMRMGWQLPNPINRIQTSEASRYPFGVLTA